MLSYAVKEALNKSNDWVAAKHKLGDLVHQTTNCVKGVYDFSKVGGAQGTYDLKDIDGESAVKLPAGAIVLNAFVYAEEAATSGGAATIDVQVEAADDLLAAEAVGSFTLGARVQGIPDHANLSQSVLTTAERKLQLSVNAADLTAGKLVVYAFYVV